MKFYKKLKFLVELVLLYLSMLSIRSKRTYVFGAWGGLKFADNPKYLFLQALRDKGIKAIWITRSKNVLNYMRSKGYPVYLYNSLPGIYYQLRASVYFVCVRDEDVLRYLLGNALSINLWHGVGLKKVVFDDNKHFNKKDSHTKFNRYLQAIQQFPHRKRYVLSTSETMTKIFSSAFRMPVDKILPFGQPRNDVFYDDGLETEELPFLASGKKMILYMPTHRIAGKVPIRLSKIFDLTRLNELCEENNAIFVVKKHFYHRTEIENLKDFKNLVDITNFDYDAQLLLKKAAVLISDYSSCYVDYLLLNKPVIFYNYDYEDYVLNDRDLYFEYDKTTPGLKVKSVHDFISCLKKILIEQQDDFEGEREKVKSIFYSEDNQHIVGGKILDFVKSQRY